jgi:signal peptide peptidase SppA
VVNIDGSLTSEDSLFNDWFNDVSYASIQRALNQLIMNDEVQSILLHIASPGGDAAGIEEASNAIMAAATVKPVVAYADPALSAGMWLAASAAEVYSSKMGQTGSIGAITSAVSYAERLKKDGVEVFVARSAPKKALNHPAEPLSEAGKQSMRDKVAALGDFFIEFMVRNRPNLNLADAKNTWASGDTFFGQQALEYGLIDGIKLSSAALIAELNEQAYNQSTPTPGAPNMPKRIVLSSQPDLDLARIALGLAPDGTPIQATTEPAPTPEQDEGEDDEPSVAGTPTQASAEPASLLADPLAAYLKEEIASLKVVNAELVAKIADLQPLQGQLQTSESVIAHLRPVAEAAVNRLSIGLGHRPSKLEHVPADMLAAMFNDLQAELMALPAGRQTAEPTVDTIEGDSGPETLAQQRLRLVPSRTAAGR